MIYVAEINATIPEEWRELLLECRAEVRDGRFTGYVHGTQSTYIQEGCRGPLCKYAQRVYAREREHAINKGRRKYRSRLDRYNEFFGLYVKSGFVTDIDRAPRRKPETRVLRTPRTISFSTVQKLHKGRARLAS